MIIDILGFYLVISFLLLIFSIGLLDSYYIYIPLSWKVIFVFQYKIYKNIKDKLNIFGIIILEAIATILTLGASLLLFITSVIIWMFVLIWKLFYFVFKKRC